MSSSDEIKPLLAALNEYKLLSLPRSGDRKKRPKIYRAESCLDGVLDKSLDGLYISLSTGEAFSKVIVESIQRNCIDWKISAPLFLNRRIVPTLKDPSDFKVKFHDGMSRIDPFTTIERYTLCIGTKSAVEITYENLHKLNIEHGDKSPHIMPLINIINYIQEYHTSTVKDFSDHGQEPDTPKELGNLTQIPPIHWKVPKNPNDWECLECGKKENLWIHLKDGFIGCGRYNYGVDGSGCIPDGEKKWKEGAAVRHYEDTKTTLFGPDLPRFACKISTCHRAGGILLGDVYDYLADCDVIDSHLDEHLTYFGIETDNLKQTGQNTRELEEILNRAFDWSDASCELEGTLTIPNPGKTGIINMGNTCYMSSILQVLAHLPKVTELLNELLEDNIRLSDKEWVVNYFNRRSNYKFVTDPMIQFMRIINILSGLDKTFVECQQDYHKLEHEVLIESNFEPGVGIMTGYKHQEQPNALNISSFRHIWFGKHEEYKTNRQQDVTDFFLQLFSTMKGINKEVSDKLIALFEWSIFEKNKCLRTNKVKVTQTLEPILYLPINTILKEGNKDITITDLIYQYMMIGSEYDFVSFADHKRGLGHMMYRLKQDYAPPYLILALQRFSYDSEYQPVKNLDNIVVEDIIDLSQFIAKSVIENDRGESEFTSSDDEANPQPAPPCPYKSTLVQLGLDENLIDNAWCTEWIKLEDKTRANDKIDQNYLMDLLFSDPTKYLEVPVFESKKKRGRINIVKELVDELKSMIERSTEECEAILYSHQIMGIKGMIDYDVVFGIIEGEGQLQEVVKKYREAIKDSNSGEKSKTAQIHKNPLIDKTDLNGEELLMPLNVRDSVDNLKYKLSHTVMHTGKIISSGHYFIYEANNNSITGCVAYNDSRVIDCVDKNQVFSNMGHNGYLLIYKRID